MLLENFKTQRLQFRSLLPEDEATLMPFFNDPIAMEYLLPPDDRLQFCRDWIARQRMRYKRDGFSLCALIHRETGNFVGQCGLIRQEIGGRIELEVGYHLLREYWKKGYATEAAIACKNFAFENQLAPSLISMIHVNNVNSQRVAERNGMSRGEKIMYKNFPIYIYRIYP